MQKNKESPNTLKVWIMFHRGPTAKQFHRRNALVCCPIVDDTLSAGKTGVQAPRNSIGEWAASGVREARREARKGNSVHL